MAPAGAFGCARSNGSALDQLGDAVAGLLQPAGDAPGLVARPVQGDEVGLGVADDEGAVAGGHD
ncbi:MAG: hypothetical protein WBG92_20335, partial [Thiohalocapsa sp.]